MKLQTRLIALACFASALPAATTDGWYPFAARSNPAPGEIGLQDWLVKPAGKHGRPQLAGQRLTYHGRDFKIWGVNNSYSACSPSKEVADRRAAWYAKYGINGVRLHKYADGPGWSGIQSEDSFVRLDPAGLDRMDYFVARLKAHGIYVKLSPTFGVKIGPGDRDRIPFMNEFGKPDGKGRIRAGYGAVYLCRELQDMQIDQTLSVLQHRNPYTGLTYAADPAIVTVEMFNEDAVLWNLTGNVFKQSPTIRQRTAQRFCAWLKARYGDEAKFQAAWGPAALNFFQDKGLAGESFAQGTIVPYGDPWFYSIDQLETKMKPIRQRMLDTMLFLTELQHEFYQRFAQAARAAGYDGPMVGSNWQAGSNLSHYYNLWSDAQVGIVDRHNYFGGARRGKQGGAFNHASMLRTPGGATLSTGMQQVADRPFMLSEWIHVQPNEYGVEGVALIGAYGMGLNAWDVSFMFQNGDNGGFSPALCGHAWDVTVPRIIGLFPAVARQIYRGDVQESTVVATRTVNFAALHEGRLGFRDKTTQEFDVKTFTSDKVSARAMAAVRCVIEFTDQYRDTPAFDLTPYEKNGAVVSSTGQLSWTGGQSEHSGHFTIDTPGTQAVVGFAAGRSFDLADASIAPACRYGAIYLTATGPSETLKTGGKILLTALARCRNTGQDLGPDENDLRDKGKPPILMEPVQATITLKRPGAKRVVLLDHDGLRTGKTIPVERGVIRLDGVRDRTPYYLIEF